MCRLVDQWLDRQGFQTCEFTDPYMACAHLVRRIADIPDLVFVGADWLSPEELILVQYLRETWPSVGVVVYANGNVSGVCEPAPLRLVCCSSAALRGCLENSPEQLLDALRARPSVQPLEPQRGGSAAVIDARPPADRAAMLGDQFDDLWSAALGRPGPTAGRAPQGVAHAHANDPGVERAEQGSPHNGAPRGILSDEELEALLGRDDV
jgi:hypothetical protein